MMSVRHERARQSSPAIAVAVLVAGLTSVVLGHQSTSVATKTGIPKEGQKAPDFSLVALDGGGFISIRSAVMSFGRFRQSSAAAALPGGW